MNNATPRQHCGCGCGELVPATRRSRFASLTCTRREYMRRFRRSRAASNVEPLQSECRHPLRHRILPCECGRDRIFLYDPVRGWCCSLCDEVKAEWPQVVDLRWLTASAS